MVTTTEHQTLKDNMTMWNDVIDEKLNQGLTDSIDTAYAEDYKHTGPGGFYGTGTALLKQANQSMREGFPDIQITNDIFGEGDRAVNYFLIEGTHNGIWRGLAPTGRKIKARGVSVVKFEGGKIIEECEYFDELTILKQLGVINKAHDVYSILSLLQWGDKKGIVSPAVHSNNLEELR